MKINATTVTAESLTAALEGRFGKPGLSTKRAIDEQEIGMLVDSIKAGGKYVRVYSQMGFVSNSYKSRCAIQHVTATLVDAATGEWRVTIGWGSAQRAPGKGSLVVTR